MKAYRRGDYYFKFNFEKFNKRIKKYISECEGTEPPCSVKMICKAIAGHANTGIDAVNNWVKGAASPQTETQIIGITEVLKCQFQDLIDPLTEKEKADYLKMFRNRKYPSRKERMRRIVREMRENLDNNKRTEAFLDWCLKQFKENRFTVCICNNGTRQVLRTICPSEWFWSDNKPTFSASYADTNFGFSHATIPFRVYTIADREYSIKYLYIDCETYNDFLEQTMIVRNIINEQKEEYRDAIDKLDKMR